MPFLVLVVVWFIYAQTTGKRNLDYLTTISEISSQQKAEMTRTNEEAARTNALLERIAVALEKRAEK